MITTAQIRGARGILGWSQGDLAERTGISATSIGSIENGITQARTSTLEIIKNVFERAGIEFLGLDGIRKQGDFIKTYSGSTGFREFMDHLYETVSTFGGEIVLFNAKPDNWYKWLGKEWFEMHSERMKKLGDKINMKITSDEGNSLFISRAFAEYRWFPKELFSDRSVYAYCEYLAFVNFEENSVSVIVIKQAEFSNAFKILFNIAWDNVAQAVNSTD